MNITVKYSSGTWYGTEFGIDEFDLTVQDSGYTDKSSLGVDFTFGKPASGRGANWENKGWVKGATLSLSEDQARKLAAAILWHLEECRGQVTHLHFSTGSSGAA
ncbi:MAG: hypothetical protein WAO76_12290 [Georgfuchsia sp.]